jgi:hypothetical protein
MAHRHGAAFLGLADSDARDPIFDATPSALDADPLFSHTDVHVDLLHSVSTEPQLPTAPTEAAGEATVASRSPIDKSGMQEVRAVASGQDEQAGRREDPDSSPLQQRRSEEHTDDGDTQTQYSIATRFLLLQGSIEPDHQFKCPKCPAILIYATAPTHTCEHYLSNPIDNRVALNVSLLLSVLQPPPDRLWLRISTFASVWSRLHFLSFQQAFLANGHLAEVCTHIHLCIYLCLCVHVYVYVYVYVCVCVCVSV